MGAGTEIPAERKAGLLPDLADSPAFISFLSVVIICDTMSRSFFRIQDRNPISNFDAVSGTANESPVSDEFSVNTEKKIEHVAAKVAELLEWFHDFAENKTYNSEAAFSYAVQMAYYAGQKYYTAVQELSTEIRTLQR